MKQSILTVAALVASLSATVAHEVAKGPNGGPVIDSGGHHVEMVASGVSLVLFLTESDDAPLASNGTKNARAIVQDAGKTATVQLEAAEPNTLVGVLSQPLGTGARVVVSFILADGHAVQARFVNN